MASASHVWPPPPASVRFVLNNLNYTCQVLCVCPRVECPSSSRRPAHTQQTSRHLPSECGKDTFAMKPYSLAQHLEPPKRPLCMPSDWFNSNIGGLCESLVCHWIWGK